MFRGGPPVQVLWGGAILGFAFGGFLDGILLHQVLQWHHFLSLVPGERFQSIEVQILALLWQIFRCTGFPNQFFCDSWVVGFGGPTMAARNSNWEDELGRWLKPFLDRLGHKARRRMCPLYVAGLIGPGDRKSVQPMAERLAPGDYDQLHHFVSAGVWNAAPLETELLIQADRLVGGSDAVLVIDDTAVPKKGTHSVGVAAQYASV